MVFNNKKELLTIDRHGT